MFRFAFRDLLWLVIVLGLVIAWRLEIKQRQRESAELSRLQVLLKEQANDFQNIEEFALDKDQQEARRLLTDWAQRRTAKRETVVPRGGPFEALLGEWEVVEKIERGISRDLKGQPSESIKIVNGRIGFSKPSGAYDWCLCTINAREINVNFGPLFPKGRDILQGLYELKGGELRIVWPVAAGKPRPTNFDALNNKQITLDVLTKKVE